MLFNGHHIETEVKWTLSSFRGNHVLSRASYITVCPWVRETDRLSASNIENQNFASLGLWGAKVKTLPLVCVIEKKLI